MEFVVDNKLCTNHGNLAINHLCGANILIYVNAIMMFFWCSFVINHQNEINYSFLVGIYLVFKIININLNRYHKFM